MQKNIVVIGGSSGIGKEFVSQMLMDNHQVYSFSRSLDASVQSANLHHHSLDVLSDNLDSSMLPEYIDAFIYCPGSILLKPLNRLTKEDFRQDYEINVVAAFDTFQKCIPLMKKAEAPKALFFSSVAASQGMVFHASISAAKGALEGFVRSAAAELAPKFTVNCIALSLTDTPLAAKLLDSDQKKDAAAQRHPLKKYGNAADIAALAKFLLSSEAGWISGQIIHADGGMSSIR